MCVTLSLLSSESPILFSVISSGGKRRRCIRAAEEPVEAQTSVLPGGMGLIKDAFMALHPWLFRLHLPPPSQPYRGRRRSSFIPGCPLLAFPWPVCVFACALCSRRPFDGGCLSSSSSLTSLRFTARSRDERTRAHSRLSFKFGFVKIYSRPEARPAQSPTRFPV